MILFSLILTNCQGYKIEGENQFLLSQEAIFKPSKIETLQDMNKNYLELFKAYNHNLSILKALREGDLN